MLLTILTILSSFAAANEVTITTADELIEFSTAVNGGVNYSGTTVFLGADLDFTGKTFEPIGTSNTSCFLGVFDGQGHVINNLKITSSSEDVGLFGYSEGLTIKNVILDSSCSITSSCSSGYPSVGGIIGEYNKYKGSCIIENNVNMASVTFNGNVSGNVLYLGGIAGYLYSYTGHEITVKNCANYGSVTYSGESSRSYIGGILGFLWGLSLTNRTYVYNCLNYGTITHSGTSSSYLYLGGIAGHTYRLIIENCVSGGKIISSSSTVPKYDNNIGSIVGYDWSATFINYIYVTSDLSGLDKYGDTLYDPIESNTFSYDSTTFQLSGTVSVGSYSGNSLIDALNGAADYYTLRDYSHWLLNKDRNIVSFTINGRTNPIEMNYQIILLPSLASEGKMSFDGWYTDSGLTTPLSSYEIMSDAELYGRFEVNTNNYTITFDTRKEGISVAPITAPFGSVIALPSESIREHCTVGWWENKHGDNLGLDFTMPSSDITLYAVWKCTHIETFEDFIDFSKAVNKGMDYSETTAFLDCDLDFTGKSFEPIGFYSWYNYFRGVFDGQGHVISNLKITSSSEYVGLFGFSSELDIRNLILDSSCSITNTFSGSDYVYVGGIVGYCVGECSIENSVNMGSVTFSGNMSGSYDILYLGGFAGEFRSTSNEITVKNCANYGTVTHSGTSDYYSYIGGLFGFFSRFSTNMMYICNSINYGTIRHSGTTPDELYVGGIFGRTGYSIVENCVSGGRISASETAEKNRIGSIAGRVESTTSVNNTYFTSALSSYKKYGVWAPGSESNALSYSSSTFQLSETVSVGSYSGNSLVDALNAYYSHNNYSNWLFNKGRKAVSFVINGRTAPIEVKYQVILMPSLASEGKMSFDGWYNDSELTTPLASYEITSDAEFYGKYYTVVVVTFDVNGGNLLLESESTMKVTSGSTYGTLPEATRTGFTFGGWFTAAEGGEEVKSGDIVKITEDQTLYAHWTAKKYNVTLDVNGGNVLSEESKQVTFDCAYGDLPEPTRTGFTFAGWFTDKAYTNEITSESVVSTPNDHTLYAKWDVVYQLTFIFDNSTEPEERTLNYNDPIIYPAEPVREGYTFNGWSETVESMPAHDLIITAQWTINQYTITFSVDGGSECKPIVQDYNTPFVLPEPTKTGYTFDCWCSDPELSIEYTETTMPAGNVTLYAKWSINQYTITFVFNNGAENEVRTLDFNEEIVYPKNVLKEGYTFNGWDNKPDRMPAENITITAQWISIEEPTKPSNPTEYVEVVFGKDFTEEEVKDILDDYTKEDFVIVKFEKDEKSGETRVIVKFNDKNDAEEFAENVDKNGKPEHFFRNVEFVSGKSSFASILAPLFFLCSFLF